jgi:hypothetical protein
VLTTSIKFDPLPHRLYDNFAGKPDGPLPPALTGQSWIISGNDQYEIRDGSITNDNVGQAYGAFNLGASIARVGAVFSTDTAGTADGNFIVLTIRPASGIEFTGQLVVSHHQVHFAMWDGAAVYTPLLTEDLDLDFETTYRAQFEVNGSTATILRPDGVVQHVTNPLIASLTGSQVGFDFYNPNNAAHPVRFHEVWADTVNDGEWVLTKIPNEEDATAITNTRYLSYTAAKNAQKAGFQADPDLNTAFEDMAADQVLGQWPVPVAQVADDLRRAEGLGPRSSALPGFDVAAYDPTKWYTAPPGDALSILRSEETTLFIDAEAATPDDNGAVVTNLATGAANVVCTSKAVLKPEDRGYFYFPGGAMQNYLSHPAITGGTINTYTDWRVRFRRPALGGGGRLFNGTIYTDMDDTNVIVSIAANNAGGTFFPGAVASWASMGVAVGQWLDLAATYTPESKTVAIYYRTNLPTFLASDGGWSLALDVAHPTITTAFAMSGGVLLGGSDFSIDFKGIASAWQAKQNNVMLIDVDASYLTNPSVTTFQSVNNKTITVNRRTSGAVTTIMPSRGNGGRAVISMDVNQALQAPQDPAHDLDAGTSMTIFSACRINVDQEYTHPYVKWNGAYPSPWIRMYRSENPILMAGTISAGVPATDTYYGVDTDVSPIVWRQMQTHGIRADRARGLWQPFMDGFIPGGSSAMTLIGDCSVPTSGVRTDAVADYAAMACVRRALTNAEIIAVNTALREGKERPYRRGQKFEVTSAGTFKGRTLAPGDLLIAATAGTVDTVVWHRVAAIATSNQTMLDTTPPAGPAGLAVVIEDDGLVELNWNDNTEFDLLRYDYRIDGGAAVPVTASTVIVTGLTNGVEYDFQVRAVDTSENTSAWTTVVSGTPAIPPPPYVIDGDTGFAQKLLIPGNDAGLNEPTEPTIVYMHGHGSSAAAAITAGTDEGDMLRDIVRRLRRPMFVPYESSGAWGNTTSLSAFTSTLPNIEDHLGTNPDDLIIIGGSAGHARAVNWAKANPGKVRAIIGLGPVSDLTDMVTNNRGGHAASINAAYSTWNPGTHGANNNPVTIASSGALNGIDYKTWYCEDDAVCVQATVEALIAAIPDAQSHEVRGGLHNGEYHPTLAGDIVAFIEGVIDGGTHTGESVTVSDDLVTTFRRSGVYVAPSYPVEVDVLVVGGGGSAGDAYGGGTCSGGGGGGEVLTGTYTINGPTVVTVGRGGMTTYPAPVCKAGTDGEDSSFGAYISASGGGGGGSADGGTDWAGRAGGCGGGGGANLGAGGVGEQGDGAAGGSWSNAAVVRAGGGGGAGGDANVTNGGPGLSNSITGVATLYGGGGGGGVGADYTGLGQGGSGGGGDGNNHADLTSATPGVDNLGGGGGGGRSNGRGGKGGAGVVIVRRAM